METNDKYKILKQKDKKYWESPNKYAILKEVDIMIEEYTIYANVNGKLMMVLYDDSDYVLVLCQKMIENGVRVFQNFRDLKEWLLRCP